MFRTDDDSKTMSKHTVFLLFKWVHSRTRL